MTDTHSIILPFDTGMARFLMQHVWEKRNLLDLDPEQMDELNKFVGWVVSHGLENLLSPPPDSERPDELWELKKRIASVFGRKSNMSEFLIEGKPSKDYSMLMYFLQGSPELPNKPDPK